MNTSLDLFNEIVIFAFFLSSVIWIGLTFYSSLISQEYLKTASVNEKKSYMINIQVSVMWYMRWSSLVSFLLSIYLMRFLSIFSVPLLALMLYSAQAKNVSNPLLEIDGSLGPAWFSISLWVSIILVIFLELNLVFGKNRNWMNTSKKVILTGLILTAILGYLLRYS